MDMGEEFWFDPWEEIERLHRRIHRILDTLGEPLREVGFPLRRVESFPVDISETEDEIIVKADLPGFEKGDVKIRATENTIEILAQKKEKEVEKGERFWRMERRMGTLRRILTLPTPVDYENAKAEMKNGVLKIVLPKKEKGRGKEIEIE